MKLLLLLAFGCEGTMTGGPPGRDDSGASAGRDAEARSDSGVVVDRDAGSRPDAPPTDPGFTGWRELEGTSLIEHCPNLDEIWGVEGCAAVIDDWSGGAFDSTRDRLIVWGGGHNGYYGNELYAIDVTAPSSSRLNDPGLPPGDYETCQEAIAGGAQPNSRHTYDGVEYIEHLDALWAFGGSLGCGSGNFGDDTWLFRFSTMTWERKEGGGDTPGAVPGIVAAYDPVTRLLFVHDSVALYAYDFETDRYRRLKEDDYPLLGYHHTAEMDPVARAFVIVGYDNQEDRGLTYVYDLSDITSIDGAAMREWSEPSLSGGGEVEGEIYPGLAFDSRRGQIVAWAGGDTAYALDLDASSWEAFTFPGGPGSQNANGTMGRFRYSARRGVFVVINAMESNAWSLALPPR